MKELLKIFLLSIIAIFALLGAIALLGVIMSILPNNPMLLAIMLTITFIIVFSNI